VNRSRFPGVCLRISLPQARRPGTPGHHTCHRSLWIASPPARASRLLKLWQRVTGIYATALQRTSRDPAELACSADPLVVGHGRNAAHRRLDPSGDECGRRCEDDVLQLAIVRSLRSETGGMVMVAVIAVPDQPSASPCWRTGTMCTRTRSPRTPRFRGEG